MYKRQVFRFFLSFNASGLLVTHDSNPDTLKDTSNERKTKDNIQYATQIRQAQHTQASNQDTSLKERKNERQTKKREKKSQAGKVNIMGTNTPKNITNSKGRQNTPSLRQDEYSTQRSRAPPEKRQANKQTNKSKQTSKNHNISPNIKRLVTHQDKRDIFHKTEKKRTPKRIQITFEAATTAVCGTSIVDKVLLTSHPDTLPACRLLSFANRVFRTSPTAVVVTLSWPLGGDATDTTTAKKTMAWHCTVYSPFATVGSLCRTVV